MDIRAHGSMPRMDGQGRVLALGTAEKDYVIERVDFPYFAAVLLESGAGSFWSRTGGRHRVTAGDTILLFPGEAHRYGPADGDSWKESFVVFEGPIFEFWQSRGIISPGAPVQRAGDVRRCRRELHGLLVRRTSLSLAENWQEVCRLQSWLAGVLAGPFRRGRGEWARAVESAMGEGRSLGEIARLVDQTPEAFRKSFRRLYGRPFREAFNEHRFQKASQLLASTSLTCARIAGMLGFCDEFYFSRFFKAACGQSPRQYRRLFGVAEEAGSRRK